VEAHRVGVDLAEQVGEAAAAQPLAQVRQHVHRTRPRRRDPEEVVQAAVGDRQLFFAGQPVEALEELEVLEQAVAQPDHRPAAQPAEHVGERAHRVGVVEHDRRGRVAVDVPRQGDKGLEVPDQPGPSAGPGGIADGVEDAVLLRDRQVAGHRRQTPGRDRDHDVVGTAECPGPLVGRHDPGVDAQLGGQLVEKRLGQIARRAADVVEHELGAAQRRRQEHVLDDRRRPGIASAADDHDAGTGHGELRIRVKSG